MSHNNHYHHLVTIPRGQTVSLYLCTYEYWEVSLSFYDIYGKNLSAAIEEQHVIVYATLQRWLCATWSSRASVYTISEFHEREFMIRVHNFYPHTVEVGCTIEIICHQNYDHYNHTYIPVAVQNELSWLEANLRCIYEFGTILADVSINGPLSIVLDESWYYSYINFVYTGTVKSLYEGAIRKVQYDVVANISPFARTSGNEMYLDSDIHVAVANIVGMLCNS